MNTTRTYARDSRLAFRQHTDYACALERPAALSINSLGHRVVPWVCVVIGLGLLVAWVKGGA